MVTQERLKELFVYDPESGSFTRKTARSGVIGSVAGSVRPDGYVNIGIDYRLYRAHRLAWLYVYGNWPEHDIDHINGNRADSSILNLRKTNDSLNMQNQRRARADNKSGVLGVEVRGRKYRAAIGLPDGERRYLGTFSTAESAHSAYIKAKRELHEGGML